jgi:hypothetical protein
LKDYKPPYSALLEEIDRSRKRIKALEELLNHAEDLFDWAAQSDCENGVRSLNKAAAATYLADKLVTDELERLGRIADAKRRVG